MANNKLNCPRCGEIDMVQKVSAAVSVYKHLEPPAKPTFKDYYIEFTSELISGPIAIFIMSFIFKWKIIWPFVISIGFLLFYFLGWFSNRKKPNAWKESELMKWEEAMKEWHELYFCARDDGVFNPNKDVFIPSTELKDYFGDRKRKE